MKHSYIKGFTVFLISIFVLSVNISCKKYLEIRPDSKLTVPVSIADLQGILDFSNDMNLQRTPGFGESSTDDYFIFDNDYESYPIEYRKIYTWDRGDYDFKNSWANAYLPVYNANYCLDQINKIARDEKNKEMWDNVKGSALFYRSYYFLGLLWDFAKVYDSSSFEKDMGIVLRLSSDFNEKSKRSTVKTCYDRVIADVKLSLNYLPDFPTNLLRPSKQASCALLARAYLSMGIYDSAAKYADLTLTLNSKLINYNEDPEINGTLEASVPFKRFNKETLFYSEISQDDLMNNSWIAKIDTNLYKSYHNNDLRKVAFFSPAGDFHKFKCIYTGDINYYFSGIATDEIYLIKSECEARLGNYHEAMYYLNSLLENRWKTGTFSGFEFTNKEVALGIILNERRKELWGRGLRWIDIKRYNRNGANIIMTRKINGQIFTIKPNANYYALPIPSDIIKASGIQQNDY